MAAAVYDVYVEQGATCRFPKFQFGTLKVDGAGNPILDADGNLQIDIPRNFTGCKFRMQIRKQQKTDAEVLATVTSEDTNGGITFDVNGNVSIVLPDESADALTRDGFWDLKCYNLDGTEDRLVQGAVIVSRAVTLDAVP